MMERLRKALLIAISLVVVFLISFCGSSFNLRTAGYFILCFSTLSLLLLPISWAIYFFFIYLGFEGFAKLITNYNPIVHVGADILIVLLWIHAVFNYLRNRKSARIVLPPLTWLFVAHLMWFLVTILNPYSLSLMASVAGAKLYVTIVSLYFFGYYLASDEKKIRRFMAPWLIVCAVQIVSSLYQASVGPVSVTSLGPAYALALKKFEGHAFRPFGMTSQPGFPSIYIYICIPFIFYFLFFTDSLVLSVLILSLLPGSLIVLLVCQVRSAIFKAALSGAAYQIMTLAYLKDLGGKLRAKVGVFILLSAASLALFTPFLIEKVISNYSDNTRAIERSMTVLDFSSMSNARHGALDRFIAYAKLAPLGAGLSRSGAASGKFKNLVETNRLIPIQFFSDNLWVELVVDLGLPGVVIFTTLIFMIFYLGIKEFFKIRSPEIRRIYGAILCSLVAIAIGSYGAEPILYNPEGPFFWFFSGVMLRLPSLDKRNEKNILY